MLLEVVAPELATPTTNLQLSDLIYCFSIHNINRANKIYPALNVSIILFHCRAVSEAGTKPLRIPMSI